MSNTFKLFRLQLIDSQLDQARARLREIEQTLADDAEVRQAEGEDQEAQAELAARHKTLRRAEEEVHTQKIKIEQTEATLYGGKVRNPKELQDLQNEAAALRRYQRVLEDRQLEAMIAVEEAEESGGKTADKLRAAVEAASAKNRKFSSEKDAVQLEIARLENERQAASDAIIEADLKIYEQLRHSRRGVAVSRVVNKACSACGSVLNAALLHAARSPNQINRCDTCGRILYAD